MDISYRTTLELDKIIARATELCACRETKEMMQAIQPCQTPEDERWALAQTDAVNSLLIKNGSPRFGAVSDARRIAAHAVKGGILSMGELLEVAATLRNFDGLSKWYGVSDHDVLPVDDLFFALSPQPVLERQITESILSPEEMADTASATLRELRRKIRQTEDSIRTKLDNIIKNSTTNKFLQDAVVSLRNGRYVVPVRAEYRGEVGGVIHDVSSTGATIFVEPTAVVEANARIMQLRAQEQEEITRILSAFSSQVAQLEPQFSHSYEAMLQIDLLLAKARLAVEQNAFLPAVNDGVRFQLNKARHPLIDKKKVVPVDITLGDEYDTLVITGPNTGGKTVSLKTAGLLNAMAQHGFLIPAHESSAVCCFAEYLVDIGDEQSIEQSLSTFSGHMKRITGILQLARRGTLVLLDELGAGTDPAEGAALAVSILERLRKQGALLMATTHYAELKVYALETPGVVNASCEFDVESLAPTYKLSVGVPGKSNAFLISAKLGIPEEIIDAARAHMSSDDKRLDSVLAQLDDLKLQLKAAQDDAEQARAQAENALASAEAQRDELIRKGQAELDAARKQAHDLVQQVQNDAYALTDELRRIQKDEKASAAQRAIRAREIARKDTEKLLSPHRERRAAQKRVCAAEGRPAGAGGGHCRPEPAGHRAFPPRARRHGGGARRHPENQGAAFRSARAGQDGKAPAPAPAGKVPHHRAAGPRPQGQHGAEPAGLYRGGGPGRDRQVHRQCGAAGPEYRFHHPRQGHRRAARRHPKTPAHPQKRQELPPGPLRRGRDRRDCGGAEITRCTKQKDGIPPPKGTYAVFFCLAFGLRLGRDRVWQSPNCPASVRHRVSLPAL